MVTITQLNFPEFVRNRNVADHCLVEKPITRGKQHPDSGQSGQVMDTIV
jgi:hypothetical protein